MNAPTISAMAALLGAAIGGLASFLASWMTQRMQMRALWLTQERLRRQDLYKEFIEEASKCYIDALQARYRRHSIARDAKIGRMRIISSPNVIDSAERVGRKILDTYLGPDRNFLELREMVNNNSIDILEDFTEACREELESLRTWRL
jgi:hypothetical protein